MHFDKDKRIIIVDDFYEKFDEIRNIALNAKYESNSVTKNYPGKNSLESFWSLDLNNKISKITGEIVYPTPTSSCGHFRYSKENDFATQIVHFDPKPGQTWAGVIYLSLTEHYEGKNSGTTFYRHKKTKIEVAPFTHEESKIINVNTHDDMLNFFTNDGTNLDLWEETLNVPIRKNRLILFRPWMWHGAKNLFGTDITNCRLIHLIFLNTF